MVAHLPPVLCWTQTPPLSASAHLLQAWRCHPWACVQVWLAALHDFVLCESDRHQANLVVQPDSTFRFIDNDHELNNRFGYGAQMLTAADGSCMPSSIFLPHSLESWRVGPPPARLRSGSDNHPHCTHLLGSQ